MWGAVCNENWNDKSAIVICRQLGFSGFIRSYPNGNHVSLDLQWQSNFFCHGDEDDLKKCKAKELRYGHCDYDMVLKCGSGMETNNY